RGNASRIPRRKLGACLSRRWHPPLAPEPPIRNVTRHLLHDGVVPGMSRPCWRQRGSGLYGAGARRHGRVPWHETMTEQPQLIVLGAGPAGMQAAMTASRHGVDTLIIDQAQKAGGQVYRALPTSYAPGPDLQHDKDFAAGETLRQELADSPARVAFGHTVWRISQGFASQGFEVEAVSAEGSTIWRPQGVIAATGAYERCIPFKGWTQPGVIGLAAATIMLKSQQTLPGRRVVVAGCGPLLAAVAASILKGGGQVAAVVDLANRSEWLAALPSLLVRP